jgi:hypothetical protein
VTILIIPPRAAAPHDLPALAPGPGHSGEGALFGKIRPGECSCPMRGKILSLHQRNAPKTAAQSHHVQFALRVFSEAGNR